MEKCGLSLPKGSLMGFITQYKKIRFLFTQYSTTNKIPKAESEEYNPHSHPFGKRNTSRGVIVNTKECSEKQSGKPPFEFNPHIQNIFYL